MYRLRWIAGQCYLCALVLMASACNPSVQDPADALIRRVMAEQEAAWDRGDIPAFMDGYADDICFIGMSGRTCGKEKVKANYQEHYPDRAAMGDLRFGIHEVVMAGTGHAWATGTWELIRTADTLGGGFSLLWRRDANGWRIIRDHTYRHAILAGT